MKKINIILTIFIGAILLFANACLKEDLNTPPGDVILSSPANATTDVALDVTLNWQETIDPDGDVVKYDVYFGTEVNNLTNVSIRQSSTKYTPILTPGTTYYWKVSAKDGREGTSESNVWNFTTLNNRPETVILTSPSNSATNVAIGTTLTWQVASDPDGDAVTYDVYLDTNTNPSTRVINGQTGTTYAPTLLANTTYFWKVIAKDNYGGTSESSIWSFSTLNNGPEVVILIAPENSATNVAIGTTLTWQVASDPDGDAVTYDVYFDTNTNPSTLVSSEQTGTTYAPTLLANTTYFWKVIAKDNYGGTSESSIWSFSTLNNGPEVVILIAPENSATNVAIGTTLTWQVASDPDGDKVTYDVYLDTNTNPSTRVSNEQTNTTYAPTLIANTTYYWKVVAKDSYGGTSESAVWSFSTLNNGPESVILIAPANSATNVAIGTALTWQVATDPDGDAVTYDVYIDTNTNPSTKVSSDQTGTTFNPTLVANTTYYWKVVAKDSYGSTSESNVWSFGTLNNPPNSFNLITPANNPLVAIGNIAINTDLIWQAATDPDGDAVTYDVYFGTSSTPTALVSSNQTGTSFSPTLSENTIYYWKVIAKDGYGGTKESAIWGFRTINPNNPPAAFNLISPTNGATNVNDDNWELVWNASTDSDGDSITYDVLIGTNTNPINVVSSNQTGTSFYPTLQNGVTYYWKVIAKDGKGGTRESVTWSFTTYINNPPEAFNLTFPANGAENVEQYETPLSWEASSDPDGDAVTYDVLLGTNANPTIMVSTNQTATYFDAILNAGTTYYWKVIAKDNKGGSRESAIWSFTTITPNNPPSTFNLISPVNGAIRLALNTTLTWQPATDPDGDAVTYDVLLGTSTNPSTVVSSDQTSTTYAPTLSSGTTYFWKVIAKDNKGGSQESVIWSFSTLNNPPEAFNLISPGNGTNNIPIGTPLVWEASTDPDGDTITYDVYFGTDVIPITIVSESQVETSFSPVMQQGNLYYWKIVAKDNKGSSRESVTWSFIVPAI